MNLKYKCLILDHDDTVVDSTKHLHYPSFQKTLELVRPEISMTFEEFYLHCFEPGFEDLIVNKLKLNKEERKELYFDFQRFLVEDTPAIFLYHPTLYTLERS